MVQSFVKWEVDDPHDTTQSLAERFPLPRGEMQQYWTITYGPLTGVIIARSIRTP